jgi:lipopolysaccharide transport system permease protein
MTEHLPAIRHQTIIQPSKGWFSLQLGALWHYRELLYFLVWRDIKVRYKQTALGVTWVILQPVVSMVVFTFLFGNLLGVPSGDVPYPIFSYAALLPWNYFASSINKSSTSLVMNTNLVTKVYFPRMVIPISSVLSGLVDFGFGFLVLIGLMIYFRIPPTWTILFLPAFLFLAMLTALGFGFWLSALNVRYRDINYLVPYLIQIWMYLTPVIYSVTLIPEQYQFLMALNPMTAVVGGFRWALLGSYLADAQAPVDVIIFSFLLSLLVLITGAVFFRRTERTFADVI